MLDTRHVQLDVFFKMKSQILCLIAWRGFQLIGVAIVEGVGTYEIF